MYALRRAGKQADRQQLHDEQQEARHNMHSHCRDQAASTVLSERSAGIKPNMRCVSRKVSNYAVCK